MTPENRLFAAPAPAVQDPPQATPWTILVVDDEPEVHSVTRLVLEDIRFQGRPVRLIGAQSAAEARMRLAENPDTAVVLLDVVMESADAGLRLVRTIREEMHNHAVRIILRTGQPGQAPERRVVVDCDINDYKAKSELTADRLFASVIAALRAYEDIRTIERFRENAFSVLGDQMGLMRDLLALCPAPLASIDPDGVISACSPAFAQALGVEDAADLVGDSLLRLCPGVAAVLDSARAAANGMAKGHGLRLRLSRDALGREVGAAVVVGEDGA